jgi:hypothetical protein
LQSGENQVIRQLWVSPRQQQGEENEIFVSQSTIFNLKLSADSSSHVTIDLIKDGDSIEN